MSPETAPAPRPAAEPTSEPRRRSVLRILTGGIAALLGVAVAAPAAALLGTPLRRKPVYGGDEPIAAIELDKLPEGVPTAVKLAAPTRVDAWVKFVDVPLGAVWLVRRGERVDVLSSTCPHAGCFIDFDEKKKQFNCPCHASNFDIAGRRLAGPSPRDMDSLAAEVRNGKVLVRFQRFRQATPDKVAL